MAPKKLITSRREIMKTMSAVAGTSAISSLYGCGSEADTTAQQESEIFECLFSNREKHALSPRGVFGKIEHVVVLMMENRSFDHYFGALSIEPDRVDDNGLSFGGEGRKDVNGLTGDEFNLDLDGNAWRVYRETATVQGDIAHEWTDCWGQFDFDGTGVGTNDGFVKMHEVDLAKGAEAYCASYEYFGKNVGCPPKQGAMSIYSRDDIPVSYALADNYTLCDQWYASVLGPTWPNRFYLHSGSSRGEKGGSPVLGMRTIWENMRAQCIKWHNYYCDLPWAHVVGEGGLVLGTKLGDGVFGGILEQFHASQPGFGSFYQAVENDSLGAFTLIDPGFSSGYDDHPPSDVALGQAFISYVYRILASNPEVWAKTLFIVTYDEHGSYYDHVVPPAGDARLLDGSPAGNTFDEREEFKQLGMRVPTLVIGPHVKKGYVSHELFEHTSIARTLYDRFDLTANKGTWLNDRVRFSASLADCIDQTVDETNAPPPADVPVLEFSESELMDWVETPFPDGQPGLADMVERGQIPREHDLRPYRKQNMLEFLEIGERVGALKVTR